MNVALICTVHLISPSFRACGVGSARGMPDILTSGKPKAIRLIVSDGYRRIAVRVGPTGRAVERVIRIGGRYRPRVLLRGDVSGGVIRVGYRADFGIRGRAEASERVICEAALVRTILENGGEV